MKWRHLPIVAFDTETTGLEPFGGDRIIEFAAVVLHLDSDGRIEKREDHAWFVNPDIPIPRKVTEITGISDSDVAGHPPFDARADQIRALFTDAVTVAHNYPFDHAFLCQEFQRADIPWHEPLAAIDTVDLSIRCFPNTKGHKLTDLSRRLDVQLDRAHRATHDAAACGTCFIELARRHEVPDDLQEMLDWAHAIGRPPEEGPFDLDDRGVPVFGTEHQHAGEPVVDHPIYLAWMEKARVRRQGSWQWRFPESSRRWIRRWLSVRGAGRARQNPKSFRPEDWVLDPCIAIDQQDSR